MVQTQVNANRTFNTTGTVLWEGRIGLSKVSIRTNCFPRVTDTQQRKSTQLSSCQACSSVTSRKGCSTELGNLYFVIILKDLFSG